MAKKKTKKSISKRFKITKKSKLKHKTPGACHLMVKKRPKVRMRKGAERILARASTGEVFRALVGVRSSKK